MTTLIIGCGYLGRRIARKLVEAGERVLGTTRSAAWAASLQAIGVEPVVLDVLNPAATELPVFDRLVYCIGFDRSSGQPMRSVYIDGLSRFLDHLSSAPKHWVYTSSTGVYGQSGGVWVDENSATEPTSESGRLCLEAEAIAQSRGACITRLAGLYGPGRIIRRAAILAGEAVIGSPDHVINLIHVDDAASAVIAALDRGQSGRIYNVADDHPAPRSELYSLTAELLGAPPVTFTSATAEEFDRRVSNQRMKNELLVNLDYPTISEGIRAAFVAESNG